MYVVGSEMDVMMLKVICIFYLPTYGTLVYD